MKSIGQAEKFPPREILLVCALCDRLHGIRAMAMPSFYCPILSLHYLRLYPVDGGRLPY
jgi:hypothetical protein